MDLKVGEGWAEGGGRMDGGRGRGGGNAQYISLYEEDFLIC